MHVRDCQPFDTAARACLAAAVMLAACAGEQPAANNIACAQAVACGREAPVAAQTMGPTVLPGFCERPGDKVRDLFCQSPSVVVRDLLDLQTQLGFEPSQQGYRISSFLDRSGLDDAAYNVVVALGHSTALFGRLVSPINPRVFLLRHDVIMAFQRGTQRVELVALDREQGRNNFYLVSFDQACNSSDTGCTPGDLFTPRIEHEWTSVAIRDDEELKNTPEDCRQCHARGRDTAQLLMRELTNPWTHFFQPLPDEPPPKREAGVTGIDLTRDFADARGDEAYANLPWEVMRRSVAVVLENAVGMDQPVLFDSQQILDERWPDGTDGEMAVPLESATWDNAYEAFKRGEQLALPYIDARATDPEKQARLTETYGRYRSGELDASDLPDLSDIFPDDPAIRARIGLQNEPNASPPQVLIQACGACHNDVLDQSISRARFSIDLSKMDRAEIELAAARVELASDEPGVMPPPNARQLDVEARAQLLTYLRDASDKPVVDSTLQHAAAVGMAKGQ